MNGGNTTVEIEYDILDLAGFQSETRTLEALPMRIVYASPRYEYFLLPKGSDWLFLYSWIPGKAASGGKIRETTNLDPYAIREAFDAVDSVETAARFLSEAGLFWPWEAVMYSQFKEWQEFFRWLRLDREAAIETPEGKKAWQTAQLFENSFFTGTDSEFTRARFQGAELPPEAMRENEIKDRETLTALRRFALLPEGWDTDKVRLRLALYDPSDGHQPESRKAQRKTTSKGEGARYEPFLRIEAQSVLEAIAATIYVDNLQRLRHGQCKQCGKIFEIRSGHGQEFCPPPKRPRGLEIKTSPCKNAYLQQQRRDNEKRAVAFLLDSNGLSESEIESEAQAKGIRLTPQAKAKAQKRRLA